MRSVGWVLILTVFVLGILFCVTEAKAVSDEEVAKIASAMPTKAPAAPKKARKILVFSLCKGFKHSCIPYWEKALDIMGNKTGAFECEFSTDMSIFNEQDLKRFDAVCLNNTTKLEFDADQRKAFMGFIKGGKGIVGIHAATDNFDNWQEAAMMMGGIFTGHPWGSGGTWAFKIDDPDHVLMKSFEGKGFKLNDEIYRTDAPYYSRKNQRVLLSLDLSDDATRNVNGLKESDADTGISWVKDYGKGRLFYCSLGHQHHVTWNAVILEHYLAGIQFAMGDLKADTEPRPYDAAAGYSAKINGWMEALAGFNYGKSRAELTELSDFIRASYGNSSVLKEIEKGLIGVLESDASLAGKQYACRELSVIGTTESVNVLAKMLKSDESADMALYALERIEGQAVDEVLRDALSAVKGQAKIGIINSIGVRGDKKAVPLLGELVISSDEQAAEAAVAALGRIGGMKAERILEKATSSVKGSLRLAVLDGRLSCAEKFVNEGADKKAFAIYRKLYESDVPAIIKIGALRGMAYSGGAEGGSMIVEAIKSDDATIQSAAFMLVGQTAGAEQIRGIGEQWDGLSNVAKMQLMTALANRGDPVGIDLALTAEKSDNDEVRAAGLRAIGALGDASSISILAEAAAAAKGLVRQAARDSLNSLHGTGVDEAIIKGIKRLNSKNDKAKLVGLELIRSTAARNISGSSDALVNAAGDKDKNVQAEALKALRSVGGEKDIAAVVEVLVESSGSVLREAQKTVVSLGNKTDNETVRVGPVVKAYGTAKTSEVRSSLLSILGKFGGSKGLAVVLSALKESDSKVKEAAVRSISDWPDASPIKDVFAIAETSDNNKHRVMALRGYVRMAGLVEDVSAEQKAKMFVKAMDLATNVGEKRTVLGGLGDVRSPAALEFAGRFLDDEQLKAEAEVAVVKIAKGILGSDVEKSRKVLERVASSSENESIRKQAQGLLDIMKGFGDFITAWQVTGPYGVGADGGEIFDKAFEPEKNGKGVKWQLMPAGTDKSRPWMMELDKFLGGDTRAAYLRTSVFSDKDQKLRLEIGSDDGVKVWLNGKVVHAKNASRALSPGQDKVDVTLNQGSNKLLFKITQGGGGWALCARFSEINGGKVESLKYQAE